MPTMMPVRARWKSRLPVSRRYPDSPDRLVPSCEWTRKRLRFRTSRAAASASSGAREVVTSPCSVEPVQPGRGPRRRGAQRREVHLRAGHDAADE